MYGFDISNERIKSVDSLPFLTYNPDMKGIMATADSNIYQDQSRSQALCRQCGKQIPIKAGKKQRKVYCSNLCRIKASTSQRKRYNKICKYCGKHYSTPRKVQKYCSRKCEGSWLRQEAAKKRMRICQWCGKEFVMNFMSGKARSGEVQEGLFCSRKCRWDWVKERTRTKNLIEHPQKHNIYFNICEICGKLYTAKNKLDKYCSYECRYKRAKTYMRMKYKEEWIPRVFKCKGCGRLVELEYGEKKSVFCSEQCAKRYHHNSRRPKQRAEANGVYYEYVNPLKVFKRDGWKCQLCGKKLKPKDRGKFIDNAPELDHIIPWAKGGEHSYRNTQCTCRKCNGDKNDKELGQLRMFG